jgi:DNA-binding protein H-NS
MSVSAVGGSGQANIAQLQRQLKKDQQTLVADQRAKASQQTQQLDEVKVQMDQSMISLAEQAQAQAAAQGSSDKTAPQTQSAATTAPGRTADGSLYL